MNLLPSVYATPGFVPVGSFTAVQTVANVATATVLATTLTGGTDIVSATVPATTLTGGVDEVKAERTISVDALPADNESMTIGSCVVTFVDLAGTGNNSAAPADDTDCSNNTATINNYTVAAPGVAHTPAEIATVLQSLTGVSDPDHGSLVVSSPSATTIGFTTSATEYTATPIVFTASANVTSSASVTGVIPVKATADMTFTQGLPANATDHVINIDGSALQLGTAAQTPAEIATTVSGATLPDYDVTASGAVVTFTAKVAGTGGNGAVTISDDSYTTAEATKAYADMTFTLGLPANAGDHVINIDGVSIDLGTGALTAAQVAATVSGTTLTDYDLTNPSSGVVHFTAKTAGVSGNAAVTISDTSYATTAQVVTFTPASPTNGETFSGAINGTIYHYTVTGSLSVAQVVTAFAPLIDANAAVVCTDNTTTVTCTAATPGTAFTYGANVVDITPPTATSITLSQSTFSSGQTAVVTVVLSEPAAPASFTNADVTVESGTLSTLTTADNTTWTGTFTPTASITDGVNVATVGTAWTDLAGNTATAGATSANYAIDTVVPTIALSATPTSVNSGATSVVTFTLSKPSTNFTAGDVTYTGGTLTSFMGTGMSYSGVFTPTASSTASGLIDVAGSTFTDAIGNNNTAATELAIGVDTVSPSVTSISLSQSAFSSGQMAVVTITLSEAASGATFDNSDVTVESGTLSTLTTANNITWTGTFTPTASITDATNVATVGTAWKDVHNNSAFSGAVSANYTIDTVVPTISVSATPTSVNSGATSVIAFTLSEPSVDFTSGDVSVAGGTFGSFMGTGMSYSGVFTPTASSTTSGTIDVAAGTFHDAAGNNNTAAAQTLIGVDTTVPTVTLTTTTSSPTNANFTVLATFSKPVTGVTLGDFTVANGVASALTPLSSTGYTILVTPPLDGVVTIHMSGAIAQDAALNPNQPSNTLSITYDGTDPTVTLTTTAPNPTNGAFTVLATFSESVTGVTAGDFGVSNGTKSSFTALSSTGYSIVVTPIADGAVDINMPFNAAVDLATNPSNAATQLSRTYDSIPPTIVMSASGTNVHSGTTSLITFTLSEPSTNFTSGDVVATGGTLTGFAGTGSLYTATFVPTASSTASGLINVASGTFSDAAGNNNATGATQLAIDVDTIVPTITMTASGTSLYTAQTSLLTFTLSEPSTNFSSGDVMVTGGSISGFAGSGTGYTATFTPTPSSTASGLINIAAGAFTDSFGNNNPAATQLAINVDTTTETDAPVVFNKRVDAITATGGTVKFDFSDASYTVGTGAKTGTGYISIGTGASTNNVATSGISVVTGSTNTASALFNGLTSNTVYNYAMSVSDNYGNMASTQTGSFVTSDTPINLNASSTNTGATTLTGSTIPSGSGISLTGTITVVSDSHDTNSVTGSLTLSGVTDITVTGSTWNGVLIPPTLIQSGATENASTGEISGIIPQTTIVTVGGTTTTTTYTSTILETVKVGGENGVSLIASGANFRVSFVVPGSSSGTTLNLYRSTNGSVWEVNSPDATCTLDANKTCTFQTNHLSFFAPTLIASSASVVTVSSGGSGGGGGGGSASIDSCLGADTSGSYYDGKCTSSGTTTGTAVTTTTSMTVNTNTHTNTPGVSLTPTLTTKLLFTDISSNWAKLYIEELAKAGVIMNTSKFNPDNNVTRAEFLKMALKGLGVSFNANVVVSDFGDVAEAWQIPLVVKAQSLGIVSGQMVDGKLMFRPNDTITRAEAMKILLLTAGYKSDATTTEFTDVTEAWQIPLVAKAQSLGIVSGQVQDGKPIFRPNDTITRAEVAKIIVKTSLMR